MLSKYWLILVATAVASSAAVDAFACSVEYRVEYEISPTATPERIVFSSTDPSALATVTVANSDGVEVPGDVEMLDVDGYGQVWIPSATLAPGSYTVTIDGEYADEEDVQQVEVRDDIEVTFSFDMIPKEIEAITDMVCCDTQAGGCFDSCAGCVSCWPAGYKYVPQAQLDIESNQPLLVRRTMRNNETGEESVGPPLLTISPSTTVYDRLGAEAVGEVCVEVIASDLDGVQVFAEERCFEMTDVERLERRTPDEPDAVRQCAEAPEETGDANWQRYGETSPLADGCNTSSGRPSTLAPGLLLLLVVFLARRRRSEYVPRR